MITKSPETLSAAHKESLAAETCRYGGPVPLFTSVSYGNLMPVFDDNDESGPALTELDPGRTGVVLVTGIASPEPLKEFIESRFSEVTHLAFPDHHRFTIRDISRIKESIKSLNSPRKFSITTAKDAARLSEFANIADPLKKNFYYIPVTVRFHDDGKDRFDKLILDYAGKDKGNS
jgi:tetraacyldisaccharide 4'-kinase